MNELGASGCRVFGVREEFNGTEERSSLRTFVGTVCMGEEVEIYLAVRIKIVIYSEARVNRVGVESGVQNDSNTFYFRRTVLSAISLELPPTSLYLHASISLLVAI